VCPELAEVWRVFCPTQGAACSGRSLSRWVSNSILRAVNKKEKGLRADKPHAVIEWLALESLLQKP